MKQSAISKPACAVHVGAPPKKHPHHKKSTKKETRSFAQYLEEALRRQEDKP